MDEIYPEDMPMEIGLIGGGGARSASGEITLNRAANNFTVTDNLGTSRKLIMFSPVGTCVADASSRAVAGIALAESVINDVITVDVSSFNTAVTTLTKDFTAVGGTTDTFTEYVVLSGSNNTATAITFSNYRNTQTTSRVLFGTDTTRWWSNFIIPAGTYKWSVIAFD